MWNDWDNIEARVSAQITPLIGPSIDVAGQIAELAFDLLVAVSREPKMRSSAEVYHAHTSLFIRSIQDLRVCVNASRSGYTMQAWTIAASGFEASHYIGMIGSDKSRAQRWLDHRNTKKSVWSAYDAVLHSYRYLELDIEDESQATPQGEYDQYNHLCIAKHVNPSAERNRYMSAEDTLAMTPVVHPGKVKEARFGLAIACRATTMGLWSVRKTHLGPHEAIDARIIELAHATVALAESWDK